MSESYISDVSGTRGSVHAGSGDQTNNINNNYYYPADLVNDARGWSPRRVAEEDLDWLYQRFVHPTGFAQARDELDREGTVLLDGPPGSGRTSAARMLLHELRDGAGAFHDVAPEDEERKRARSLNSTDVGDRDRLLLDFSNSGEQFWADIQRELPEFRATVRERGAHLVVVLPTSTLVPTAQELARHRVMIAPPQQSRVLRTYLRNAGLSPETTGETPAVLADFLSRKRPIRELALLADLIFRASTAHNGADDFARWCELACGAVEDRAQEVARLVTRLRKGPPRALLLVTAMLHEAHADAVHRGTDALLRAVGGPPDERPLLERADLAQRLARIGAAPGPDSRVCFTELGYDSAIRSHFWRYLPEVRRPLGAWVADAIGMPELGAKDRDALVQRFSDQCLSTSGQGQLAEVVRRWAAAAGREQLRAATKALECGLQHEEQGGSFRQLIYDWSRESLTPGLTSVLVGVCAEVMAVRYPGQALVRLHHLARRQRDGTSAREALLELAAPDQRLRRLMLARLVPTSAWAERYWRTDTDLFLALADPDPLTTPGLVARALIAEATVRGDLVRCWSAVFETRAHQDWTPQVRRWLGAAVEDERYGDLLLSTLVEGCGVHGRHLARLYVVTRDWVRGPENDPRRGVVAERLRRKIDAAQGYRVA